MTEQVAMRAEAVYSGVSFAVWKVQGAWFWSLVQRMAKVAPSAPLVLRLKRCEKLGSQ
jgi:hypothetical protein